MPTLFWHCLNRSISATIFTRCPVASFYASNRKVSGGSSSRSLNAGGGDGGSRGSGGGGGSSGSRQPPHPPPSVGNPPQPRVLRHLEQLQSAAKDSTLEFN